MNDQLNIAGAASAVDFIVGELPCKIRPITVADQFDYETWVRGLAVAALAGSSALTLDQKMRATLSAMSLGWFSDACIESTATVMGKARLLWLATRDSLGLTFDQFRDTVTEEQLHAGFSAMAAMSWGNEKKKQ